MRSPPSPELAQRARELAFAIERLRQSRSWRAVRGLQRRFDGLRGRAGGDALARLGEGALQLAALLHDGGPSGRASGLLEALRAQYAEVSAGETWRSLRLAGQIRDLVLRRRRMAGPAEEVAARLDALCILLGLPGPAAEGATLAFTSPAVAPAAGGEAAVDVLVPVCGALDETHRCLAAVRGASCRTPFELVVIDDSGRDPAVARSLEAWQAELGFTCLTNARNEGYVRSIERGISLHPERDVVLLNSDAYVNGSWLDRLRAAAYGDWRVGSVTPWSNDAEITSYPVAGARAPVPDDETLAALDDAAARAHPRRTASLPTAVGFCTYVRRDCLDAVGSFDVERFGRGYGEEIDFSMRARRLGWRNVLAADTYVAHTGGVSFGSEKIPQREAAQQTVEALHPGFRDDVSDFVRRDPLRPLRRGLDLEMANASSSGADAILLVSQAVGGGTGRHVAELAQAWEAEGVRAWWLHPSVVTTTGADGVVRLERPTGRPTPNLFFGLPAEEAALDEALRALEIGHVHYHHTLGVPDFVLKLPAALGVAYDFTLHDWFAICPRVHLVGASGRYCGEPDAAGCRQCVSSQGSAVGSDVDILAWRERAGRLLAGARRVFVPSEDAAKRLGRYFPGVDFAMRPHAERPPEATPSPVARVPGENLRVAVIGALDVHKGSEVLQACVEDASARGLPLEFHVVGHTDRDEWLRGRERVVVHGPYEEARVYELLAALRCHRALIPSVTPETYCYALSIALAARLQPVAFDLGAVAERIRGLGWGTLVDPSTDAARLNDALLASPDESFPESRAALLHPHYADLRRDYYEQPFP